MLIPSLLVVLEDGLEGNFFRIKVDLAVVRVEHGLADGGVGDGHGGQGPRRKIFSRLVLRQKGLVVDVVEADQIMVVAVLGLADKFLGRLVNVGGGAGAAYAGMQVLHGLAEQALVGIGQVVEIFVKRAALLEHQPRGGR